RVLKQRNTLLKTAGAAQRGSTLRDTSPGSSGRASQESALSTLGVWDAPLARTGAEILAERLSLVAELRPYVGNAYATVARGATSDDAGLEYQPSLDIGDLTDRASLTDRLLEELELRRSDELDRGVSLVGPHRDKLALTLGDGEPS